MKKYHIFSYFFFLGRRCIRSRSPQRNKYSLCDITWKKFFFVLWILSWATAAVIGFILNIYILKKKLLIEIEENGFILKIYIEKTNYWNTDKCTFYDTRITLVKDYSGNILNFLYYFVFYFFVKFLKITIKQGKIWRKPFLDRVSTCWSISWFYIFLVPNKTSFQVFLVYYVTWKWNMNL